MFSWGSIGLSFPPNCGDLFTALARCRAAMGDNEAVSGFWKNREKLPWYGFPPIVVGAAMLQFLRDWFAAMGLSPQSWSSALSPACLPPHGWFSVPGNG